MWTTTTLSDTSSSSWKIFFMAVVFPVAGGPIIRVFIGLPLRRPGRKHSVMLLSCDSLCT